MKNLEIQEKNSQEFIISRLHQVEDRISGLEDKTEDFKQSKKMSNPKIK